MPSHVMEAGTSPTEVFGHDGDARSGEGVEMPLAASFEHVSSKFLSFVTVDGWKSHSQSTVWDAKQTPAVNDGSLNQLGSRISEPSTILVQRILCFKALWAKSATVVDLNLSSTHGWNEVYDSEIGLNWPKQENETTFQVLPLATVPRKGNLTVNTPTKTLSSHSLGGQAAGPSQLSQKSNMFSQHIVTKTRPMMHIFWKWEARIGSMVDFGKTLNLLNIKQPPKINGPSSPEVWQRLSPAEATRIAALRAYWSLMLQSAQCHPRVFWHSKSSWKRSFSWLVLKCNMLLKAKLGRLFWRQKVYLYISPCPFFTSNSGTLPLFVCSRKKMCGSAFFINHSLEKNNLKNSVKNTWKHGKLESFLQSAGAKVFHPQNPLALKTEIFSTLKAQWLQPSPTELKWVETEHMSDVCNYEYIHLYRSIWVYNIINIIFI